MQSEANGPLTLAVVFENLQAFQKTFALKAAIELDIFGAVGKGPCDVASIAKHAKASERGTRILCDFLVISGLLRKEDGLYRHTPASAAFLDPMLPTSSRRLCTSFPFQNCASPMNISRRSFARAGPSCPARARSNRRIRFGWSSRKAWRP